MSLLPRAFVAALALLWVACGGAAARTETPAGPEDSDTAANPAATETPREDGVGTRPADTVGLQTLGADVAGVSAGHIGHGGRADLPEPVAGPVTREGRPVHDRPE